MGLLNWAFWNLLVVPLCILLFFIEFDAKLVKTKKKEAMDSEKALELVKHGATLLFLDVPQYTLVGIDTQVCLLLSLKLLSNFNFSQFQSLLLYSKFKAF